MASLTTAAATNSALTPTPPGRRIRIRPATRADLDDIVRIQFAAFAQGAMTRLMYAGGRGPSPDARAKFGAGLLPEPDTDPSLSRYHSTIRGKGEQFVFVAELSGDGGGGGEAGVVEGMKEGGEEEKALVVAYAKWILYRQARPKEEWDKPPPPMTTEMMGHGTNIEVFEDFLGGLRRIGRSLIQGSPELHLNLIASDPSYQRLGAASALIQWGVDLADSEGLASWVEASPFGYAVYRRFGYEDVAVQDLPITDKYGLVREDWENWGQKSADGTCGPWPEGCYRSVFMRRVPRGAGAGAGSAAGDSAGIGEAEAAEVPPT